MPKPWTLLATETVLKSPYIQIHKDHVRLENGKELSDYYVFEFNDWARVLPITPDNNVILVEQYRHGVERVTFEFPAGAHDAVDGDMLTTAKRELLEETGFSSDDWLDLGGYKLGPARIKNGFHLFCALNCIETAAQNLDSTEEISVHIMTPRQCDELFAQGRIIDTDSALVWQLCKSRGLV